MVDCHRNHGNNVFLGLLQTPQSKLFKKVAILSHPQKVMFSGVIYFNLHSRVLLHQF